ncbi:MAG: hypothetical protein ACKOPQ_09220 [Novosphingobium sp.]|jgi:hypothetical protein
MRPSSIVSFDRLYLVATALGLVNSFMSMDQLQARISAFPALRAMQAGSGVVYLAIVLSVAIPLLLWFLVAYKRSVLAKWILVGFTALAILNLPATLTQIGSGGGLGMLTNVAVDLLRVAALSFLFRADAKAWLAGGPDTAA